MNIVPFTPTPPEPGSNLDYALQYAALGWYVFPVWGARDERCRCNGFCKSIGKHPVGFLVPRGMEDATTDPVIIRRWWNQMPDAGIAINLAPSGLVAIDIDPRNGGEFTIEAVEQQHGKLESDVVALTQGGGEHRIFHLRADINVSLPGKLGDGVDVKRNGYIVVAPTQGQYSKYIWEGSSDPLDGAIPSPLPDWIRDLSAPATQAIKLTDLASYRHATDEQVAEIAQALTYLPSDDRETWVRFGLALKPLGQRGWNVWDEWSRKSSKYNPSDSARVWRSFKHTGAVNFESIFYLAQQAGWINPLSIPQEPVSVPVERVKVATPPSVPPAAFGRRLPGVLGAVEDWVNATSRKPQPAFAVQTALAFGAAVLGRRYVTSQRNWPSLYFLCIGKSSSGKEHGKWAIEALLEACKLGHLVGPAFYTSSSGVLSALQGQPSHITCVDEFGKVLEGASVRNNHHQAAALTALMEVWGRCDGTVRYKGYSTAGMSQADIQKLAGKVVRNPALTLLAMTTPESFYDSVGSKAAQDGFLNRFLTVETDVGRQPGRHVVPTPIPEEVITWAQACHAHDGVVNPDLTPELMANPKEIPISREALKAFEDFEIECIQLMDAHDADGMAEMFGRTNEIAMRLSLIICLGCGDSVVDVTHAQWAIEYARHHAVRTVEKLKNSVADTEFEAGCNQVMALIRKAGEHGLTANELQRLSRRFRGLDMRGRMNILNTLSMSGQIAKVAVQTHGGRGKKREAWVAVDEDAVEGQE